MMMLHIFILQAIIRFTEHNGKISRKQETFHLVADMSSDILSKKIDVSKFGIIYAGAQKNLGPSGITVVIIRKDLITDNEKIPSMMNYSIHSKNNSLYNTPPTLAIYLLSLVLDWAKEQGGVEKIAEINRRKSKSHLRCYRRQQWFL